ncbi:hypothetical protein [Sorangium sp. So ce406]|uniref:hypothetical protein n=1 Tax=Sorangium sp. So ce406 TaxID=3133311 RepID=UPI003F5C4E0D
MPVRDRDDVLQACLIGAVVALRDDVLQACLIGAVVALRDDVLQACLIGAVVALREGRCGRQSETRKAERRRPSSAMPC